MSASTLIFPKFFEFYKFFSFFKAKNLINSFYNNTVGNHSYYHLVTRSADKGEGNPGIWAHFYIFVVDQSDIGFLNVFNDILTVAHASNGVYELPSKTVILIGSCGSNNKEDLGKMFFITKATKMDRGSLDENNTFTIRSDKALPAEPNLPQNEASVLLLEPREIISLNFFNETDIDHEKLHGKLFDMETYEFFTVCNAFKDRLDRFFALRFVTDYVEDFGRTLTMSEYCEQIETKRVGTLIQAKERYDALVTAFPDRPFPSFAQFYGADRTDDDGDDDDDDDDDDGNVVVVQPPSKVIFKKFIRQTMVIDFGFLINYKSGESRPMSTAVASFKPCLDDCVWWPQYAAFKWRYQKSLLVTLSKWTEHFKELSISAPSSSDILRTKAAYVGTDDFQTRTACQNNDVHQWQRQAERRQAERRQAERLRESVAASRSGQQSSNTSTFIQCLQMLFSLLGTMFLLVIMIRQQ